MKHISIIILLMTVTTSLWASSLPTQLATCNYSAVTQVSYRLGDSAPDSGSAIQFAGDEWQVSYDRVPGVENSKAGDAVIICLVSVPTDSRAAFLTTRVSIAKSSSSTK